MNRELKRISALVLLMFTTLFVASSIIQVFQTDSLDADARNQRARADQYSIQRGRIRHVGRHRQLHGDPA